MKEPSWSPKLRGKLFCSDACGHGCTLTAFKRARIAADGLAAAMGKGWAPVVWENMGWHFRAVKDVSDVRPTAKGYIAFINADRQFIAEAATPKLAFLFALEKMDVCAQRLVQTSAVLLEKKQ